MARFKTLPVRKLTLSAAVSLIAGAASADTLAHTSVGAYLRAGPGTTYPSIAVVKKNAPADVSFCLRESRWCQVTYDGEPGWIYGDFLAAPVLPMISANPERDEALALNTSPGKGKTRSPESAEASADTVSSTPADVISSADLDGMAMPEAAPSAQTLAEYGLEPVEPAEVSGNIRLGSAIPRGIPIYQVPDSRYAYLNVDGRYLLVQPTNRRVVQIIG